MNTPVPRGTSGDAGDGARGRCASAARDHADLGDLVIALLSGVLADLRDRLMEDGYQAASDLVADLVEASDDYLHRALAQLRSQPR